MDHTKHLQETAPGTTRSVSNYSLPDVPLVTANGKSVRLAAELDTRSPVMVNFIFTSCTAICPLTTAVFADVQHLLETNGRPFRLISISIDPEQDTPARLREYAGKFGAGDNWHFLTGDAAAVLAVQQAFGAWRGGKTNHAPITFLRAAPGTPWVRYDGMVDAETLVAEYYRSTANLKTVER
jgi:protein SCO1/2